MSITVACPCGKSFRTKDENAGRRTKCPACGEALVIPTLADPDSFINPILERPVEAEAPSPPCESKAVPQTKVDLNAALRQRRRSLAIGGVAAVLLVVLYVAMTWENPEFQGKTFSEWKKQSKDTDPETKAKAIAAIGGVGRAGHARLANRTLAGIIAGDEPPIIKALAARVMAEVGQNADGNYVLQTLVNEMPIAKDSRLRHDLGVGIGRVIDGSREINRDEGWAAIKLVINTEGFTDNLNNPLEKYANDPDPKRSEEVVSFLGHMLEKGETQAKKATNVLHNLAFDTDGRGKLAPAIPYLVKHIRSDLTNKLNQISRYAAVGILGRTDRPQETVPVLIEILNAEYSGLQDIAIDALEEMGPIAKEAIPALMRCAQMNSYQVERVNQALSKIRGR